MIITIIAGARPNFVKIAPIIDAIHLKQKENRKIEYRLVHTGQHYDEKMSSDFFGQLDIAEPHVNLEAGSGTQAEQTANIMTRFEKELQKNPADLVMVVGDVTSTLACSIVAKKLNTKVAHVEAGIRSFDMSMPEEINRIVTDALTDYFFTTSEFANVNLRKSGVADERIFFVGNTMIDSLLKQMSRFKKPDFWDKNFLKEKEYFVITLHRPANVDSMQNLQSLISEIIAQTRGLPIIFPVHPRTAKNLAKLSIKVPNFYVVEPMSYLEFNYLVKHAKATITDSGGITEETTVMGVPCITLRNSTERPETCTIGTNELIGTDPKGLKPALDKLFNGNWKKGAIPELWDGKTAVRIVEKLVSLYYSS